MKSLGEGEAFLWCLFNSFLCWNCVTDTTKGNPKTNCVCQVLPAVCQRSACCDFHQKAAAVCTPAPAWREVTGSIRFSKLAHSWHTDHHQYLQGDQIDLQRWESSRQRCTASGRAEAHTAGCTAECAHTRMHACTQSGGVRWWGGKKEVLTVCGGLMWLPFKARHLAVVQTVTVGTVNSNTSCPWESHLIIYALIIAPVKLGELNK